MSTSTAVVTAEEAFVIAQARLIVDSADTGSEALHGFSSLAHSKVEFDDFWVFVEQLSGGRSVAVGKDGTHLTQRDAEPSFIESLVPAFRAGRRD